MKPEIIIDDSESTASDSDFEDCPKFPRSDGNFTTSPSSRGATINDDLQNKLQNINSVGIGSSSDIHFGTKTVYQGSVTIKQFLVNDEENVKNKSNDGGTVNGGFEGEC
jgi:hypothetical protein